MEIIAKLLNVEIIKLRSWFRVNGKMDFEINGSGKGDYITYKCDEVEKLFERTLNNGYKDTKFEQLYIPFHNLINMLDNDFVEIISDGKKHREFLSVVNECRKKLKTNNFKCKICNDTKIVSVINGFMHKNCECVYK